MKKEAKQFTAVPIESPSTVAYQITPAGCSGGRTSVEEVINAGPGEWIPELDWIYEPKSDGIRYLYQLYPRGATHHFLTSRRVSVQTGNFVEKQDTCPHLKNHNWGDNFKDTILDGEIVSNKGEISSDTQHSMVFGDVRFVCWDIVFYRGEDLRRQPLKIRRKVLEKLAPFFPDFVELTSQYTDPKAFLNHVTAEKAKGNLKQYEIGCVGKELTGEYYDGWLKIKDSDPYDVVIMDYEMSTSDKYGPLNWIKAVKFGQYYNGELLPMGQTSGMDEAVRKEISENQEHFKGVVIEIQADFRFKTGKFRHPRFNRFRYDKNASECIWDKEASEADTPEE